MMRFSVMRTLASVVVAFMVLGYPVIGQTAKNCGVSVNSPPNPSLAETDTCVAVASQKPQLKEAKENAVQRLQLPSYCTATCTKPQVCPDQQQCKPISDVKAIKELNSNKITKPSDIENYITCAPAPPPPSTSCNPPKPVNYHCSISISNITCCCNCPGTKTKNITQSSPVCQPGEDCDICGPDLVDLDEFTATPQNDGISLTWTTKSELDSQGFRIWRGTPDLGKYCGCSDNMDDYKQITMTTLDEKGNPTLIPATGSTTSGSNYAYLDKEVKPGIPYCYALEDIDSNGESKFYFEYISFTPDAELEKGTPK